VNMTQPPEENYAPPSQPAQPQMVPVALPTAIPRVTYTILGITVFVYLIQMLSQYALGYDLAIGLGAKSNAAIRAGQLWRFFTPMLLHGSIFHIGFNMYALYIIGIGLERRFGHGRFLLLYLLSGFAGSVFSFLLSSADSIGASGAIFGLIGAEGIFLYHNRKLLGSQVKRAINNVIFIVVLNLLLGLSPGIDNWAHVGGLMGGLIFAWFAGPLWEVQGIAPSLHVVDQREPRDIVVASAVVAIIFCTLAAIGMWFPFVQ
jgi:rhomboid protease GluP